VKERTIEGFSTQVAEIRHRCGLTREEFGKAIGVTQRVIAYYERDDAQPPRRRTRAPRAGAARLDR
jgi:DNA-binding XRE family transcriptional regulator